MSRVKLTLEYVIIIRIMHLQVVQRIKPMIKALSMVDDCKGSFVNIFLYYKLKVEGSSI